MDPSKTEFSGLKYLPQDILGMIISKVGAASPMDYRNAMLTCLEVGATAEDERVCENVNLGPLVKKPLECFKYYKMMKMSLSHNNKEAHYIKGIIEYFVINRPHLGLYHLRRAADAGKKEAVYLYVVILLYRDRFEESKNYFCQLKLEEDRTLVNTCWANIKESLHEIRVQRKRIYFTSMRKIKPTEICYLNDMSNSCPKCFYWKTMLKFIFLI